MIWRAVSNCSHSFVVILYICKLYCAFTSAYMEPWAILFCISSYFSVSSFSKGYENHAGIILAIFSFLSFRLLLDFLQLCGKTFLPYQPQRNALLVQGFWWCCFQIESWLNRIGSEVRLWCSTLTVVPAAKVLGVKLEYVESRKTSMMQELQLVFSQNEKLHMLGNE